MLNKEDLINCHVRYNAPTQGFIWIDRDISKFDYILKNNEIEARVNASNGLGYMGGILGKHKKLKGVAESIHYETKGLVEKECKALIKREGKKKKGDIFLTSGGGLDTDFIIHAVTVDKPGQKSDLDTVDVLIPKILEEARKLGVERLIIPLLGTGTGGLSKEDVRKIFIKHLNEITDIKIFVIDYNKGDQMDINL